MKEMKRLVARLRNSDGISLIEILVALTTFSVGLMALGQLAFATSKSIRQAGSQMTEWAVVQQKMDSLTALGWSALDGEAGSESVSGKLVSWQVTGADPRVITVSVPRGRVTDKFVTYVAK